MIDFTGALFDEASQTLKVNQGRVQTIRVGTPEPGTVRVVLDLSERVDYRVLPDDNGARYYIQLLPPTERTAPLQQRRLGRTIMLDPGHGGSDPGAPGMITGVWEAPLNLQISQALADELRQLGYDVLLTRSQRPLHQPGRAFRLRQQRPALPLRQRALQQHRGSRRSRGIMTFHHPTSLQGAHLAQPCARGSAGRDRRGG